MQYISRGRAQKRCLVLDGDDVLVVAYDRGRGTAAGVIGDRHDDAGVREAVLLPVSGQHALAGFAPAVTVIHELDRHRADECGSFEYVWDQAGFLGCHGPGDSGRRAATL